MSLILHLSDLHLGAASTTQYDITDKFGLESVAGSTRKDHLLRTIDALIERLQVQGRRLDAVVVSGDLTNGNKADGYTEFGELLERLRPALVDPARFVVVPGNHDTNWALQPGDPAKLDLFLDAVRSSAHTPLLYGVDYDDTGADRDPTPRQPASPILDLDDVAIVALSTADFCGVVETKSEQAVPWDEVLDAYLKQESESGDAAVSADALRRRGAATEALRKLRTQDMARVNPLQLESLKRHLKAHGLTTDPALDRRVRVAVLHHPIGPVSDREEVKAFESVTNLTAVRNFLFDVGFHVVLHGHKHEPYFAWDWLLPPGTNPDANPWRVLVLGAPGDFSPGGVVCRLIDVPGQGDEPVAGAPRLRVIDVEGVRPLQELELVLDPPARSLFQPFVGSMAIGDPWIVRADTADAAYQQLRDLPTNPAIPRPVISIVEDPDSTGRLPSNYPEDRDAEWLAELVAWWQHPRPEATGAFSGSDFNHGERLHRGGDAVAKAASALPSSKAFAILVDSTDAGAPNREYPALTAIQLQVRANQAENGTLVDIIGLYRKQDLALWWPVNMSELALMQRAAIQKVIKEGRLAKPVAAGRLIAIATIGTHENVLPQMAGTTLDRSVDLEPDLAHRLAHLAARPTSATFDGWRDALADIGTLENGIVLVPSIGVDRLERALSLQSELGGDRAVASVASAVATLASDSAAASEALRVSSSEPTQKYWARTLTDDVAAVLEALAFDAASDSFEAQCRQ